MMNSVSFWTVHFIPPGTATTAGDPMNVLFLNSCRTWGGGEVSLTQIADSLMSRGHSVTVACRRGSALHHRMNDSAVNLVPMRFGGDFDPFTILALARLIVGRKIDVVCVHTEKELRVGGVASLLAGVPVIVSREVDFPLKDTFLNRLFYGRVASVVIANSFATKNTLLISAPWLGGEKIHVVWKGVDVRRFRLPASGRLREEFHVGEEDSLIGFVGRLDEQKGLMTLLEAMALLVERHRNAKLVLAGEGNLRAAVQGFLRSRDLDRHAYLAGFREDIPEFLRGIDFLVMPSNWEGFGYAAVEAMAAGKAIVASHVSSLPEIIDDRRTGLLVPPRSPEMLADAMVTLVDNPQLRTSMGKAGARKVENVFTLSTMVANVETLLLEAASLPRTAGGGGNFARSHSAGWRLLSHWLL
jgi:glycosyltransferase involved in cell wall biosynthesis